MSPNAQTEAADRQVIEAIDRLVADLKAEKKDRRAANRKLWLAVALSVLAGIGVVVNGVVADARLKREVKARAVQIEWEQRQRTVAVCEAGNERSQAVRDLLNDLLDAGARANSRRPPAERERDLAGREAAKQIGAQRLAPRDCAALAGAKP